MQQNMMDFSKNMQTNHLIYKDCENNESPMIAIKSY